MKGAQVEDFEGQRDVGVSDGGDGSEESIREATPTAARPLRLAIVAAAIALVVGLGAGVAIGIFSQAGQLDRLSAKLDIANKQVQTEIHAKNEARAEIDSADERARKKIEAENAERIAAMEEQEKKLAEREASLVGAEQERDANQFGSGVHTVGVTVPAGTFTTNVTSGMCYYAWKDGTGAGASIIDNNIVEAGPATVTLVDGQIFENNGCGTWVRQ